MSKTAAIAGAVETTEAVSPPAAAAAPVACAVDGSIAAADAAGTAMAVACAADDDSSGSGTLSTGAIAAALDSSIPVFVAPLRGASRDDAEGGGAKTEASPAAAAVEEGSSVAPTAIDVDDAGVGEAIIGSASAAAATALGVETGATTAALPLEPSPAVEAPDGSDSVAAAGAAVSAQNFAA